MRVYVSSAGSDLSEFREAVVDALREGKHQVLPLESVDIDNPPPDFDARQALAQCEVYVGVFAYHYGSCIEEAGASVPELEYRAAADAGMSRLIYLLGEDAPWPRGLMDRGDQLQRIEALREELRHNENVSVFGDPGQLVECVVTDIGRIEGRSSTGALTEVTGRDRRNLVFLSAKSADYGEANKVCDALRNAGVGVFFTNRKEADFTDSRYRMVIDQALEDADHMVVATSAGEHAADGWVHYEWTSFHNLILSGEKPGNLVTVTFGGVDPHELPLGLRMLEVIPVEEHDWLDQLLRYVRRATEPAPPAELQEGPHRYVNPVTRDRVWVYRDSGEVAKDAIKEALLRSSEAVLIGTGINVLQDENFRKRLMDRIHEGACSITVCMANPWGRLIESRLMEEELGKVKPGVGASGIERLLAALLSFENEVGSDRLRTLVFDHYPTMCLIRADDRLFFYPYGHKTLGNYSPTFSVDLRTSPAGEFFAEQMEMLLVDAVPARELFAVVESDWECPTDWPRFAVYLVPPEDEPLYEGASAILGYDVRRCRRLDPDPALAPLIGQAQEYGAHVTVGDALVAQTAEQIRWVAAELDALSHLFPPFDLYDPRFSPELLERGALALAFDEPAGVLEALHAEVATRINVRAAGSQYTMPGHRQYRRHVSRSPREQTMLRRYKSPYVLTHFLPHLTLLSGLGGRLGDCAEIERQVLEKLGVSDPSEIEPWRVREIHLMVRSDGLWQIRDSFRLRGTR